MQTPSFITKTAQSVSEKQGVGISPGFLRREERAFSSGSARKQREENIANCCFDWISQAGKIISGLTWLRGELCAGRQTAPRSQQTPPKWSGWKRKHRLLGGKLWLRCVSESRKKNVEVHRWANMEKVARGGWLQNRSGSRSSMRLENFGEGQKETRIETAAELSMINVGICACDRSIWRSYITRLSAAQRRSKPPSWVDLLYAEPATECIESADAAGDDSTRSRSECERVSTDRAGFKCGFALDPLPQINMCKMNRNIINTDSDDSCQEWQEIAGIITNIPKVVKFITGSLQPPQTNVEQSCLCMCE